MIACNMIFIKGLILVLYLWYRIMSIFHGPYNNITNKFILSPPSIFNFHWASWLSAQLTIKKQPFRRQIHKASLRFRCKYNQRYHTCHYSFLIQAGLISSHWGRGRRGGILSEPMLLSLLTNCLNNSILDNPLITLLGTYAESGTSCWTAPVTQLKVNTDAQVLQQGIKNLQNCWAWKQHITMIAPAKGQMPQENSGEIRLRWKEQVKNTVWRIWPREKLLKCACTLVF